MSLRYGTCARYRRVCVVSTDVLPRASIARSPLPTLTAVTVAFILYTLVLIRTCLFFFFVLARFLLCSLSDSEHLNLQHCVGAQLDVLGKDLELHKCGIVGLCAQEGRPFMWHREMVGAPFNNDFFDEHAAGPDSYSTLVVPVFSYGTFQVLAVLQLVDKLADGGQGHAVAFPDNDERTAANFASLILLGLQHDARALMSAPLSTEER